MLGSTCEVLKLGRSALVGAQYYLLLRDMNSPTSSFVHLNGLVLFSNINTPPSLPLQCGLTLSPESTLQPGTEKGEEFGWISYNLTSPARPSLRKEQKEKSGFHVSCEVL